MTVLPAIDLLGGRCVRLTEGRLDSAVVYGADPLAVARRWADAGARWLHVVDLDGAVSGSVTGHRDIAAAIARHTGLPVQFGGGVRSVEDVRAILALGIARVVLGTLAALDPAGVEPLLREAGERIAVGLDARAGVVRVRGWEASSERQAMDLAAELCERGARRFVYTDIARDGTLTGPNVEATRALARVARVPVTASGGVATLEDLRALAALEPEGVDEVIVGKALYEGRFSLESALEACA